jgi:dihydroflavonol-4-reductase
VEEVTGDLRDPVSLQRAAAGCGLLFHVAADYRLWAKDPAELYRSNVDGTRNLLEAARGAGVERVVYTSTVGCIGIPAGGIGDETVPVKLAHMMGDYKRSKFLAEMVALEFARAGFPVVIVNPTAPLGDHDVKPTPTGKIVLDFLKGDMPAFIDTGLNVVDVQDTALGHWQACERGRVGERYIRGFYRNWRGLRGGRRRGSSCPMLSRIWRARSVRRGRGLADSRRGSPWTPSEWPKRRCG